MGQAYGRIRDLLIQLQRPLGHFGGEPARPFVGLVEVYVVERDPDAQRPDDLDLVVESIGLGDFEGTDLGQSRGLGLRVGKVEREVIRHDGSGTDAGSSGCGSAKSEIGHVDDQFVD